MFLIGVGMTGNTWKWLVIVGWGCMSAVNSSNLLKITGNGQKQLKMNWKLTEMVKKLIETSCPENLMFITTVMRRVVQLLYWPEECQGDK